MGQAARSQRKEEQIETNGGARRDKYSIVIDCASEQDEQNDSSVDAGSEINLLDQVIPDHCSLNDLDAEEQQELDRLIVKDFKRNVRGPQLSMQIKRTWNFDHGSTKNNQQASVEPHHSAIAEQMHKNFGGAL